MELVVLPAAAVAPAGVEVEVEAVAAVGVVRVGAASSRREVKKGVSGGVEIGRSCSLRWLPVGRRGKFMAR